MARISYTKTEDDGMTVGGVFNSETAESFEGSGPDPDGYVETEELFLTEDGYWILNQVADIGDPVRSTYVAISDDEAREWLEKNDHPEAVKRYFERPKGGRPSIGEKLITKVPIRMYNQIESLAEAYAEEMPETTRRLLREALTYREMVGALPGPDSESDEGGAESRRVQHDALIQVMHKIDGAWDTERVVAALALSGHVVSKKRARRILRDIAEAGLLKKIHDRPVQYLVIKD